MYKPGSEIHSYFNAGDVGVFVNIIFTSKWVEKNIPLNELDDTNSLKAFFSGNKSYMIWEDIVPDGEQMSAALLKTLKADVSDNSNHLLLTMQSLGFMVGFLNSAYKIKLNNENVSINKSDSRNLANAEHLIIVGLTSNFPGIDLLAQKAHMSPTKLKALFKQVYGKTLFQYYQEKQMQLALNLLRNHQLSVNEVASQLQYANVSNFNAAFKKYHQFLPSEV